jgi:hypothetical protein
MKQAMPCQSVGLEAKPGYGPAESLLMLPIGGE